MKIKNYQLKITKDIIDRAKCSVTGKCMVALALREQIGAWSVNVTAELIRFNLGERRYCYPTPASVAVNICQFDVDKSKVAPFIVKLDARQAFSAAVLRNPTPSKRGKTKIRHRLVGTLREPRRYHGHRQFRSTQIIEPIND